MAKFIDLRYGRTGQEVLGALYVNARHDLLEERELYRGKQQRASVEPREILRYGLLCGAAGVVMFHTHPSGDPAPSARTSRSPGAWREPARSSASRWSTT